MFPSHFVGASDLETLPARDPWPSIQKRILNSTKWLSLSSLTTVSVAGLQVVCRLSVRKFAIRSSYISATTYKPGWGYKYPEELQSRGISKGTISPRVAQLTPGVLRSVRHFVCACLSFLLAKSFSGIYAYLLHVFKSFFCELFSWGPH